MTTTGVTTRERLDNALRDYVSEVADGAILTDYFIVTASTYSTMQRTTPW